MFFSKMSIAMAAFAGCSQVSAFFRMQCHNRLVLDQVDPIVQPDVVPSKHIHSIMGGSNFSPSCKGNDLKGAHCTSCRVKGDGSAYWVPVLYFKHASTGKMELVVQKSDMLVYYLPERGLGEGNSGSKNVMFPENFAMVAGDPGLRNYTVGDQPTEASRRQRGIGFNCLNYSRQPEGFLQRRKMPTKAEMRDCADGLRADIAFPACWNGKDADSPDHRSHVAYPHDVQGGACPDGFEHRLPSILYETLWDVAPFNDVDGEFIWSNGDATGYGYHGDFMFGWQDGLFEQVMADPTCTHLSSTGGEIESCNTLKPLLQTNDEMSSCTIEPFSKDNLKGGWTELPGSNPITYGPEYAGEASHSSPKPKSKPKPKTTKPQATKPKEKPVVVADTPDYPQNVNVPAAAPPPASTCNTNEAVVTVTQYETSTVYVDETPAPNAGSYGRVRRHAHAHGRRHHKRRY